MNHKILLAERAKLAMDVLSKQRTLTLKEKRELSIPIHLQCTRSDKSKPATDEEIARDLDEA